MCTQGCVQPSEAGSFGFFEWVLHNLEHTFDEFRLRWRLNAHCVTPCYYSTLLLFDNKWGWMSPIPPPTKKKGDFAYDGNFEFGNYFDRAFSKWHHIYWIWSIQSGVIHEMLLEILTVFIFCCLFLENLSGRSSQIVLYASLWCNIFKAFS